MNHFDDFLQQIKQDSACHVDEIVRAKDLYCGKSLNILHGVSEGPPQEYVPTSRAEGQLLARMDIPAGYLHRCPRHLYVLNLEYWLKKSRKKLMLRCRRTGMGRLITRAVVSQRFDTTKDDQHVFPVLIEALRKEAGDTELRFVSGTKWDDFTQLIVTFPESVVVHQDRTYTAGISITNSEVGLSTLCIQPIVQAGYQTARSFLDKSNEGTTRLRHTGTLNVEELPRAVSLARETAEVGIAQLIKASTEKIEKPAEAIEQFVKATPIIPSRVLVVLEKEWRGEEEASRLELAVSLLAAVEGLPVFQKYLAQQEVGRYLDLFSSSKGRLAAIVEDAA